MVAQLVDAVWVWRYNSSAFKSTYGRISAGDIKDDSYTKDYLQAAGACGDLLSRKFHVRDEKGARTDIYYVWPGGETSPGFINYSADRFHASWEFGDAPAPWKVGLNPTVAGPQTIPGNPSLQDQATVTEEWERIEAQDLDAYLVGVKLRDEDDRLHIRAYLNHPPAGMEWASLDKAPEIVREAAASTNKKRGCASVEVTSELSAPPEVAVLIEKLEENPNVLLVGPPGTGKTVLLERLTHFVENNYGAILFDPEENHDSWPEADSGVPGKSRTVVFHPSYGYENLVVGLMPAAAKGGMSIKAVPGPLLNLSKYASGGGNRALLVLDEFNRGNAAAVLGDALALLDRDKRESAYIDLPFSEEGINVPTEFGVGTDVSVPARFTLPKNLWIVAAMNSSDRSVAPIDAALRRRFTIVEMPPDYEALTQQLNAAENLPADEARSNLDDWSPAQIGALAVRLLRQINRRIDAVLGPDFRLGQSNLWNVRGETSLDAVRSLRAAFDYRIVPTLRLSMQDDDGTLAAILLGGAADAPTTDPSAVAHWVTPSMDTGTFGVDRLHVRVLSDMPEAAALGELRRQAGV